MTKVTMQEREGENHDEMVARYEREMEAAGWGYEDTKLTDEELAAFAAQSEDNRRMVKNYERGIITGGEFDMRRLCS